MSDTVREALRELSDAECFEIAKRYWLRFNASPIKRADPNETALIRAGYDAARAALREDQTEPVAWVRWWSPGVMEVCRKEDEGAMAVYLAAPIPEDRAERAERALEAADADAARYRWLQSHDMRLPESALVHACHHPLTDAEVDRYIDAARAKVTK